jgi:hypothetical protein
MLDVSVSDHTLALWGAITGTVGSIGGGVALFNLLRERPRLELLLYTQMLGSKRELVMTAVNHGRRPAIILSAGIASGVHGISVGRLRRKRPHMTAEMGQPAPGVLPITLAPFEALRWSYTYDAKDPPPPDSIAFVQDSDGRFVWPTLRRAKPSRVPRP